MNANGQPGAVQGGAPPAQGPVPVQAPPAAPAVAGAAQVPMAQAPMMAPPAPAYYQPAPMFGMPEMAALVQAMQGQGLGGAGQNRRAAQPVPERPRLEPAQQQAALAQHDFGAPPANLHGYGDTRVAVNAMIARDPLCGYLVVRNCGMVYAPQNADDHQNLVTMCRVVTLGRFVALNAGQPVTGAARKKIAITTIAECYMPSLPADYYHAREQAQPIIKEAIRTLLAWEEFETYFDSTRADFRNAIQQRRLQNNAQAGPAIAEYVEATNFNEYVLVWKLMAEHMLPAAVPKMLNCYVAMLIAVIKRGTMTAQFVTKVVDGIMVDFGANVNVDEDTCALLYKHYGRYVDDVAMHHLSVDWVAWLPQQALRIRITIEQAAGAGLTALKVIVRALKDHPRFPWELLHFLPRYGAQFANVLAAIREVGNNRFYGYKPNLGIVASTHYSMLAWVAKEVLIKSGGNDTLTRFGGFARNTANDMIIQEYITRYIEELRNEALGGHPVDLVMVFGRERDQQTLATAMTLVRDIRDAAARAAAVYD